MNTPDPDLIKSKSSSGVGRSSIAAPQIDGMDRLYDAIGEMLLQGTEFEKISDLGQGSIANVDISLSL